MPLLICKLAGMADHSLLHRFLVSHVPRCCTLYSTLRVKECSMKPNKNQWILWLVKFKFHYFVEKYIPVEIWQSFKTLTSSMKIYISYIYKLYLLAALIDNIQLLKYINSLSCVLICFILQPTCTCKFISYRIWFY